jgi:hypothetical protein
MGYFGGARFVIESLSTITIRVEILRIPYVVCEDALS